MNEYEWTAEWQRYVAEQIAELPIHCDTCDYVTDSGEVSPDSECPNCYGGTLVLS